MGETRNFRKMMDTFCPGLRLKSDNRKGECYSRLLEEKPMAATPEELRQLAELCALLDGFELEPVNDWAADSEETPPELVTVLELSPKLTLVSQYP